MSLDSWNIWTLTPTPDDLKAGAFYASVSLPWTYNRMSLMSRSEGQQSRALNIAKGIVVQETLRRQLEAHGIPVQTQRKSYRDGDLFDFRVPVHDGIKNIDIKSFHFYTDYSGTGRQPLSAEFIHEHRSYEGPEWRRFFPMLVPQDQIRTAKDIYCFAISSSIDPRRDPFKHRSSHAIAAFPYGNWIGFFSSNALCLAREAHKQGFGINLTYVTSPRTTAITLAVIGEWDGQRQIEEVELVPNRTIQTIKPFSGIASFRLRTNEFQRLAGQIEISVSSNTFDLEVRDGRQRNVNIIPGESLVLKRTDFCNLVLPDDFRVYVLGWITKEDFVRRCRNYRGWLSPDAQFPNVNRLWTAINSEDRETLSRIGIDTKFDSFPQGVPLGIMRKGGKDASGACCYVFPYVGRFGGVKETNLFVLPDDLNPMESLVE